MKKVSILLLVATMLFSAGVTASPTVKAPKEQVSKIDNAIDFVWADVQSENVPGYSERFTLLPVCIEQPPVSFTEEMTYGNEVQESLDEPYIEGDSPVPRWHCQLKA